MTPPELLKAMFQAAVDAAAPSLCVPAHLPRRPKGRTIVIGAGKASGAMARAVEDHWEGPLEGLVVTRYGHKLPTTRIEVVEARAPRARRRGTRGGRAHPQDGARAHAGRPRAVPDLRRGLGAARASGRGPDPGRQAGRQQGAAQVRRHHRRDECGEEAPLGHQGRQAGGRRRAGARRGADDLGRPRRRSFGDRLGTDGRRPDLERRRARHHREIRHPRAAGHHRAPARESGRDAEARRRAAGGASRTS